MFKISVMVIFLCCTTLGFVYGIYKLATMPAPIYQDIESNSTNIIKIADKIWIDKVNITGVVNNVYRYSSEIIIVTPQGSVSKLSINNDLLTKVNP